MRVTGIAITPPPAAAQNPKATPELMAACLAKYSRSQEGLHTIFSKIDWGNPDASVEAIFRFIDYGHASIGGLTGGIAIAVDGLSMYLIHLMFYYSQMSDGQESSTRYIKMGPESLPEFEQLYFSELLSSDAKGEPSKENLLESELLELPKALATEWKGLMIEGFDHYNREYERLDKLATKNPEIVRYPAGANDKVRDRIRKNFALDRARYFMPFASKNNIALIMTARMWAQTIKQLDALPYPEARELVAALRSELCKFAPRLIKHSHADDAVKAQRRQVQDHWTKTILANGVPVKGARDKVKVSVERSFADFLPPTQTLEQSVEGKANRYSLTGEHLNRIFVRAAWNNVSIAEMRDLNRHRTGYRYTPMVPTGFYLPKEVRRGPHADYLGRWSEFCKKLVGSSPQGAAAWPYSMLLGTQVAFEHAQMADKFVYEVELRTGMGAHFRYAEHLGLSAEAFFKKLPEARGLVKIGTAEPE